MEVNSATSEGKITGVERKNCTNRVQSY